MAAIMKAASALLESALISLGSGFSKAPTNVTQDTLTAKDGNQPNDVLSSLEDFMTHVFCRTYFSQLYL